MSRFSQMARSARAAHTHFFSGSVQLAEPGKAIRSVQAVLGKTQTESRTDGQGREQRVTVRSCRFVELETVDHTAIVSADGMDWSIDQILKRSASGLHVELKCVQTHDVARPNYRGKQ